MPQPPSSPAPRRSGGSDGLLIGIFGAALALLILYKWWPEPAPQPEPAYSSQPAEAPRSAEDWEARSGPSAQQQWEEPARSQTGPDLADVPPASSEQAPDLEGLEEPSSAATTAEPEDKVYTYVEQMPQPPGGMEGLMQHLNKHVKYPAEALRNQVEGKVFVNFIVRPDGRITDVKVTRGIGAGCDEEAVRVISQMPRWTPGKQNGRVVSVQYTVPVTFAVK